MFYNVRSSPSSFLILVSKHIFPFDIEFNNNDHENKTVGKKVWRRAMSAKKKIFPGSHKQEEDNKNGTGIQRFAS